MSARLGIAVLCLALCGLASTAHAHAPLPRGMAVSSQGTVAVRMPGFGLVIGDGAGGPFRYACDALVGINQYQQDAPIAFRSDGALLIGTTTGVRIVEASGCPTGGTRLEGADIAALAAHDDVVYGATFSNAQWALQRSDDGGESWQRLAMLDPMPITGLVVDPSDPDAVYLSQLVGPVTSHLLISTDGGASFDTIVHDQDIKLVAVQATASGRVFWATGRVTGQGVGVEVLRAEHLAGPWQVALTVNFFGGLAFDPEHPEVIWVGDEARGVFRSSDGGLSFEETQPEINAACLAFENDAVWSCTPGLPDQPAVVRSPDALDPFESVMAFNDATEVPDCGVETDSAAICAAAWLEWEIDVLAAMPSAPPDAGSFEDAAVADAAPADTSGSGSSGCSVSAHPRSVHAAWLAIAAAIALRALRRRPRGCGPRAIAAVPPSRCDSFSTSVRYSASAPESTA